MTSEPQMFFLSSSDRRRGRPTRSGVPATKRIQFLVTDEECNALKKLAEQEGKSVASVIRDSVNERVADYGEKNILS